MTRFIAKPDTQPWLNPYLALADFEQSRRFYSEAFGFALAYALEAPDGTPVHAEYTHKGDTLFMCAPEDAWPDATKSPATSGTDSPISLAVYVDDIDAFHARAVGAGAPCEQEPADQFYGDRTAVYRDPSGYRWSFHSRIENLTPDQMREAMMREMGSGQ